MTPAQAMPVADHGSSRTRGSCRFPPVVMKLFDRLDQKQIRYCHWKSNKALEEALGGSGDLDLLVHHQAESKFSEVIGSLGFRHFAGTGSDEQPAVRHYFAYDEQADLLIHLHVYFRINSGGALTKSCGLPFEQMLLENTESLHGVCVPIKAVEMIVLVVRKILEFGTLSELPFMVREHSHVLSEFGWCDEPGVEQEAERLWRRYLPFANISLFRDAVAALRGRSTYVRLFLLGRRFHRAFKTYHIYNPLHRFLKGSWRFARHVARKLLRAGPPLGPSTGGSLIAVVGADGSGKSTIVSELTRWLEEHFAVEAVHAGKPPATCLTWLPNRLLPLFRALFPRSRPNTVEFDVLEKKEPQAHQRRFSLMYVARCLFVSHDQWALLRKCYRKARRGRIVILDRFPASNLGGMDGPRISPDWFQGKGRLKLLLARCDAHYQRSMPAPDIVLFTSLPVEEAVRRSEERNKPDDNDTAETIRFRHRIVNNWKRPDTVVVPIDTNQELEVTLREAKVAAWRAL